MRSEQLSLGTILSCLAGEMRDDHSHPVPTTGIVVPGLTLESLQLVPKGSD